MVLQRNKIMNEKDNKNSLSDLIVGSDTKDDLSVNNQKKKLKKKRLYVKKEKDVSLKERWN